MDDLLFLPLFNKGKKPARHPKRSQNVDIENLPGFLDIHIVYRPLIFPSGNPGIIDKDVDMIPFLFYIAA